MVLKRPFLSDTGVDSVHMLMCQGNSFELFSEEIQLWVDVIGLVARLSWKEVQAILTGDRAVYQYDSFKDKMIL